MPTSLQGLTSPTSAWVDEVTTLAPTTPRETSTPKFSAPEWKITIQNRDGSTSEVDMRQGEIRISMMPDNTTKSKESLADEPEVEKLDTSKDVSVTQVNRTSMQEAHILRIEIQSPQGTNLGDWPTCVDSIIRSRHHRCLNIHPRRAFEDPAHRRRVA
jgi:hypothetical protein